MASPGDQKWFVADGRKDHMIGVRTTQDGMQSAIQKFQFTADEFTSYLRAENQSLSDLRSSYTGDSASSFGAAMDDWENQFGRVINDLLAMMRLMGVNVTNYIQTEDHNANIVKSLTGQMLDPNAQPVPGMHEPFRDLPALPAHPGLPLQHVQQGLPGMPPQNGPAAAPVVAPDYGTPPIPTPTPSGQTPVVESFRGPTISLTQMGPMTSGQ